MTEETQVAESAAYDNFLDAEKNKEDKYINTLEAFVGKIEEPRPPVPEKKDFSTLYVYFETLDDIYDFCKLIGYPIYGNKSEEYYPLEAGNSLVDIDGSIDIDKSRLKPKNFKEKSKAKALVNDDTVIKLDKYGPNSPQFHWKGMPVFNQPKYDYYRKITMRFRSEDDFRDFEKLLDHEIVKRKEINQTPSMVFPPRPRKKMIKYRWMDDAGIQPDYPVYIISKGRHESMLTSRVLSRMGVNHYICVEPQDMDNYKQALINFNMEKYVTLLEAPFSNHGDGPGRARNWCWDHSISIGADAHWVMDDNIRDFYRLHENKKIRMDTGVGFKVMEDFFDRYENVYIAGPNYYFFIAEKTSYPQYVANTRIYSVLLIRNDCPHRWRGRYNEDTDLSLRVLKDGYCTLQFNNFLQGKVATQTLKGGNTAEFYHAEGGENKEAWRDSYLNSEGTVNKSQMLVDMHPDVATMVWKWGRWHHVVDYSPFEKNKLKLKPGIELPEGNNEYGMYMIDDYDPSVKEVK